jgi:predicted Zn-dependent peptidase
MKTNLKTFYFYLVILIVGGHSLYAQSNFKLPAYESFRLDNGLTIYMVVQKEVPLVHFRAVVPAGTRQDTNDKAGLAALTADALSTGTESFDKTTIESQLDFLGASYDTSTGTEAAVISSSFVNKDALVVLPILAEMIMKPTFDLQEFEKLQERAIAGVDQMRESPRSVIGNYFNQMDYGDHPNPNIASGTKQSLQQIGIQDLKNFYAQNYQPQGSVLAIVGDFDPVNMKIQLSDLLSTWKNNALLESTTLKIKTLNKANVVVVNKEDARETTMLVGGIGVPRNVSDYIGIQVINTILGGRFTSWLNDELRVNSGLTYGARSSFSALRDGGSFSMSTFTANETTEQTIDLLLKTYQKIHEVGIDTKTLESAKNYVKGQFPPDYETNAAIARFFTDASVYKIPMDYIDKFTETVNSLDSKKAKQIIEDYFPKDNLQMVFVGKASEITPIVGKFGPVKVLEITEDTYY